MMESQIDEGVLITLLRLLSHGPAVVDESMAKKCFNELVTKLYERLHELETKGNIDVAHGGRVNSLEQDSLCRAVETLKSLLYSQTEKFTLLRHRILSGVKSVDEVKAGAQIFSHLMNLVFLDLKRPEDVSSPENELIRRLYRQVRLKAQILVDQGSLVFRSEEFKTNRFGEFPQKYFGLAVWGEDWNARPTRPTVDFLGLLDVIECLPPSKNKEYKNAERLFDYAGILPSWIIQCLQAAEGELSLSQLCVCVRKKITPPLAEQTELFDYLENETDQAALKDDRWSSSHSLTDSDKGAYAKDIVIPKLLESLPTQDAELIRAWLVAIDESSTGTVSIREISRRLKFNHVTATRRIKEFKEKVGLEIRKFERSHQ